MSASLLRNIALDACLSIYYAPFLKLRFTRTKWENNIIFGRVRVVLLSDFTEPTHYCLGKKRKSDYEAVLFSRMFVQGSRKSRYQERTFAFI